MPIQYSIDIDNGLIHAKVSDDLTLGATVEYFKVLMSDPDCPPEAIEIVDFTDVTDFAIRYSEMRTITKLYNSTTQKASIRATVFLCPTNLSFGIGRMLEIMHELVDPGHVIHVARSQDDVRSAIMGIRSS